MPGDRCAATGRIHTLTPSAHTNTMRATSTRPDMLPVLVGLRDLRRSPGEVARLGQTGAFLDATVEEPVRRVDSQTDAPARKILRERAHPRGRPILPPLGSMYLLNTAAAARPATRPSLRAAAPPRACLRPRDLFRPMLGVHVLCAILRRAQRSRGHSPPPPHLPSSPRSASREPAGKPNRAAVRRSRRGRRLRRESTRDYHHRLPRGYPPPGVERRGDRVESRVPERRSPSEPAR